MIAPAADPAAESIGELEHSVMAFQQRPLDSDCLNAITLCYYYLFISGILLLAYLLGISM